MITAHGAKYATPGRALARVFALRAENEQYGPSDGRVTEINAIEAALKAHHEAEEARRKAAQRPYVVLYRKAKGEEVFKGRRTFKTAAEQSRWISEAPADVAITFYTT